MSEVDTGRTSTEGPSSPATSVSGPHVNGHLVYTGKYKGDKKVQRLFIHEKSPSTKQHSCRVYSYNVANQEIDGAPGESARTTVIEHGWFRDLAIFEQICANHPTPNGQAPQDEIFSSWRDSLLTFLDTHHSGSLWTRIN
ncbi:hypothetical protein P171DRAFT_361404 [Karstenula rhodostoma CBS 690.94]|uniref:Uncharacterized protein n=1 Tax=Karstenula rhodostoma CBS 690.94 TaxID=1392251 RepID=A0A9P4UCF2_9PLEO|nr:hypothetical protein P171DRAFT_361404 [Karstenula rhodostoma CBS 690.94]